MKCRSAVAAVTLLVALSACDRRAEPPASSAAPADVPAVSNGARPAPHAARPDPASSASIAPADTPSVAPAFAQVFPGATLEGDPVSADGAAGPGGLLTFTTEAAPETVITFYRNKAEAAGLARVMAMDRGDSQAYGASNDTSGAAVQVVATAVEDAPTSVQLSWSAGQ